MTDETLQQNLLDMVERIQSEPPSAGVALTPAAKQVKKSAAAFKTISEVADLLSVPQHVLRFWESRFPQIKPTKMRGGRRYYRPEDIVVLTRIKHLLYREGYTIKGAKKAFDQKEIDLTMPMETVEAASAVVQPFTPAAPKAAESNVNREELQGLLEELYELRSMLKTA